MRVIDGLGIDRVVIPECEVAGIGPASQGDWGLEKA